MGFVAACAAGVVVAVVGWGAWGAHTRASVWLDVNDHAGATPNRRWVEVRDGRIELRDAAGHALARAELDPPHGLPRWTGPAPDAVDCRPQLGPGAWQDCWARQSRWMARWAPRVHEAQVGVGGCTVSGVPVRRVASSDWWLWWLPLPHAGGAPISHYRLELHIDSGRCIAPAPP